MNQPTQRDQVFISYSNRDRAWLDRLQVFLKPVVRNGKIDVWADTEIKTGDKWREEINAALLRARVAVLLVTQNFTASDFIVDEEIPHFLEAAEKEGLTILWVPLTECLVEELPIYKYQAASNPKIPLAGLAEHEQDKILADVARQIRDIVRGSEAAKPEIDEVRPDDQARRKQLQSVAAGILESTSLRRWILKSNGLPIDMSAGDLADKLFAIVPELRDDEPSTAMDFLAKCIDPDNLELADDRAAVCGDMQRLVSVLAPVCLVVDNPDAIQQMIDNVTTHAAIESRNPQVGTATIARLLGLSAELDHKDVEECPDGWSATSTFSRASNRVRSASTIPEPGMQGRDIVQLVAAGLARLLPARSDRVESVKAKLTTEKQRFCYLCLWLKGEWEAPDLEKVREAFPQLFILVSASDGDSHLNETVLTQIEELRDELPLDSN